MKSLDPAVVEYVRGAVAGERYAAYMRDLLVELIAINTAAEGPLDEIAARERHLFDRIEREIRDAAGDAAHVERPAIDPAIAGDPAYSPPGYAADADGNVPPAEVVYAGRGNLFALVGGNRDSKPAVIMHAHVDVVPPWFGPRVDGERIIGRGACDNKAQVAVLLAQMKLLRELEGKFGSSLPGGRVYQFVIDEEIGGNGSLSASRDARFAGVPVLMHESTDLVPYCAHRGAVYYRCRLSAGTNEGMSAVELFPFVVMALESEGRKLQRETEHPGFTADHVQTNHGVLGCYGRHPGVVCDHVAVELTTRLKASDQRIAMKLTQMFEAAMAEYNSRYGDKQQERDSGGRPKVERHFDVKVDSTAEVQRFRVDIWGRSGHMAAVRECDGAITKAALLFTALLRFAGKYPNIQGSARLADLPPDDDGRGMVLEGGQGFTPAHQMADVQARMTAAASEAVKKYCKFRGRRFEPGMIQMSFDRLHNNAYADSPEIAPMQALRAACAAVGHPLGAPVAWETSCDARIYHHRGHPVAIFGAGKLSAAHSDSEFVELGDLRKALTISTLATWAMMT